MSHRRALTTYPEVSEWYAIDFDQTAGYVGFGAHSYKCLMNKCLRSAAMNSCVISFKTCKSAKPQNLAQNLARVLLLTNVSDW